MHEQQFLFELESGQTKQAELKRMKVIATALLLLAMAIFIVASVFEEQYMWVGFVRATAEAAMVGAIADWFAVTALFRHPLGLKIPHTAIIPRRKNSLARNFGQFVQTNFLSETVIGARLRSVNLAKVTALWLSQAENSRAVADFVAVALNGVLQVVKDEDVQQFIERGVIEQVRRVRITPIFGSVLELVTSGERKKELLGGAVKLMANLLEENKEAIRQRVTQETPWWLPEAVDERIYQKIVVTVEDILKDIQTNPDNPLHEQFDEMLDIFVVNLKHSPEMIAQGEALKEEFLQDPIVQDFSASLWRDLKTSLVERSANPNSNLHRSIQQGVQRLGMSLQQDEVMLAKINQWIEDAARYLIAAYGHEVGQLITHTIIEWDAEATSYKIELQVGKDLQYIRINGTLVGGLVGLLIHTVSVLLL